MSSSHKSTANTVYGDNAALIHERTAAAYWERDQQRNAELNVLCKIKGRCLYCGSTLSDEVLARTPGCCAKQACRAEARREVLTGKVGKRYTGALKRKETGRGSRRGSGAAR